MLIQHFPEEEITVLQGFNKPGSCMVSAAPTERLDSCLILKVKLASCAVEGNQLIISDQMRK